MIHLSGLLLTHIDRSAGPDACWPWLGYVDQQGYGVTAASTRAHMSVWRQKTGLAAPRGLVIRHTCDNRRCCNPAHLELGTHADNVRDRVERGRSAKGETHGRAKLDSAQALAIYNSPETAAQLARDYGLDASTVRAIKRGKTWASVTTPAV